MDHFWNGADLMTGVSHQALVGSGVRRASIMETITGLGLTSGLQLCLDAGDAASYTSGQAWLDTSGNGYDFFRGTTSASQASDPTFNGVAGAQSSSEYWSFDGGDWFTYDTTNETWMQNLHKNNAKFSMAAWVYITDLSVTSCLFGTDNNFASNVGMLVSANGGADGDIGLLVSNGGGAFALDVDTSAGLMSSGQWTFCGVAYDEATGSLTFQVQGTQEVKSATYTSPSASSATYTLRVGDGGNGDRPMRSGSRIANMTIWEGVTLAAADLTAIFQATRTKFGV